MTDQHRRQRSSTFGNARKLPSGRWQGRYWHEGRRYTSPTTFETKADADAWLAQERVAVGKGAWIDPEAGKETFKTFANAWLEKRRDLRPQSVRLYRSLLDVHLIPAFGMKPIAKVTPSAVSAWYSALVAEKPGVAPSAYRLLRAIFMSAVRDEQLVRSPCKVIKGGTDRAVERPMLTVAEVEAITEAMPANLRVAVTLAAWGGLRRGEVLALRRRHIDPLRSRVRVEEAQVELKDGSVIFGPPKTDTGVRTVHLPENVMSAVEDHLAEHVDFHADALLFTGRGAVPMRPRTLATAFRAARLVCGRPEAHFHDLRHFALTMAAITGATTKELMSRAGHRSSAAALRYQHATEDRDRAIAEALSTIGHGADVMRLAPVRKNP